MISNKIYKYFFILISFLFIESNSIKADYCKDYLLLDGSEQLVSCGMDSTKHWWAKTSPFTNRVRLTVDGNRTDSYNEITDPVFSPDGNRWACFAEANGQNFLITDDTVQYLPGNSRGELLYTPDSETLVYSYFDADLEKIKVGNRTYEVFNRTGKLYISHNAQNIAYFGYKNNSLVINLNGRETTSYDEILPIGFWYDGEFLYAARNGMNWQIYKNETPVSEIYLYIYSPVINIEGTVAGAAVKHFSGRESSLLIADEYYEPVVSKEYDDVTNVVLHPSLPMIAFNAIYDIKNIVVFNSAEYYGGDMTGKPSFTSDGSEMIFMGSSFDCFLSINGRQHRIKGIIPTEKSIAKKPGSPTFAYTTGANLIVNFFETKELAAGIMVDYTLDSRYNRFEDRYEALGIIGNRLYLLTCREH